MRKSMLIVATGLYCVTVDCTRTDKDHILESSDSVQVMNTTNDVALSQNPNIGQLKHTVDSIKPCLSDLPKKQAEQILNELGSLQSLNIKSPNWIGNVQQYIDSGKLSYEETPETVYYEIAKKLVIDIKNLETQKRIYKEISRNCVRKSSGESFAMFNLYGWEVIDISANHIVISQLITKLDSDVGDELIITLTKDGEVLISNKDI